jgi:hypothetical protein
MKSWTEFEHGMSIGPRDQNGNRLHFGDKVIMKILEKVIEGRIVYLPEEAAFAVKEERSSQVWRIQENLISKKQD